MVNLGRRSTFVVVIAVALGVAATVAAALGWVALAVGALAGLAVLAVAAILVCAEFVIAELRRIAADRPLTTTDGNAVTAVRAASEQILAKLEATGVVTGKATEKATEKAVATWAKRTMDRTARIQRDQTSEVEALLQLYRGFEPRAPMPSAGRWAMNPTDLLELLFLTGRDQPKVVLELGSGTSTVWLGYALERFGGRVISIDHEPAFADRTRSLVAAHRLSAVVDVRLAPLVPVEVGGESFPWYDVDVLADVEAVDLLLVDGPPGAVGPLARFPALPLLEKKLASPATVIVDDADRPDEEDMIARWTSTVDGLVVGRAMLGTHAVLSYSRR